MTPTIDGFREIYPEFDDVPDDKVGYILSLAQEIHSCSVNAVYALTAHLLALASVENTGGTEIATNSVAAIKKSRVGRIATEYANMIGGDSVDSYYQTTPYGRLFLALKDASSKRLATRVY
jgi:hypothetical protein